MLQINGVCCDSVYFHSCASSFSFSSLFSCFASFLSFVLPPYCPSFPEHISLILSVHLHRSVHLLLLHLHPSPPLPTFPLSTSVSSVFICKIFLLLLLNNCPFSHLPPTSLVTCLLHPFLFWDFSTSSLLLFLPSVNLFLLGLLANSSISSFPHLPPSLSLPPHIASSVTFLFPFTCSLLLHPSTSSAPPIFYCSLTSFSSSSVTPSVLSLILFFFMSYISSSLLLRLTLLTIVLRHFLLLPVLLFLFSLNLIPLFFLIPPSSTCCRSSTEPPHTNTENEQNLNSLRDLWAARLVR